MEAVLIAAPPSEVVESILSTRPPSDKVSPPPEDFLRHALMRSMEVSSRTSRAWVGESVRIGGRVPTPCLDQEEVSSSHGVAPGKCLSFHLPHIDQGRASPFTPLTLICRLSAASGKALASSRVTGPSSGSNTLTRPQRVPRAREAVSKMALQAPARARPAAALMHECMMRRGPEVKEGWGGEPRSRRDGNMIQ